MIDKDKTKEQLTNRVTKLESRIAALEGTIKVLLNATSDLALLVDTRGEIFYINEPAARRFGKEPDELINTNIYEFYSDEEKEVRMAYMEIVNVSGQPVHYEEVYKNKVYTSCIYPVFSPEGEIEKYAIFYNDITEHKKNEETIYRYSQIFSTVNAPMCFVDSSYIYRTANDAYLKIYEKKKEEVIGRPIEEVFGREVFQEKIKTSIDKCLSGKKVHYQGWFHFKDGKSRFMYMSFNPLFTIDRKVLGAVINAVDITRNREMEDKLKKLYVTDRLTGIYNRAKFCDALDEEIKNLETYTNSNLSLIMFDIDHFKRVNDTYGHDVGDDVIKGLVKVVKSCTRDTDVFARWGGKNL